MEQAGTERIPKLLRLGLHWGKLPTGTPVDDGTIPKLLRLGLHWGLMKTQTFAEYARKFLSFYA